MYTAYTSHNDATMCYKGDALRGFHTFKEVVLLGRASKKAMAVANALRTALVKKRKVDEKTNTETWTPTKWREMNAWQEYLSHNIEITKELDADFNFPKIHLLSH
jgi:hypothetical protein